MNRFIKQILASFIGTIAALLMTVTVGASALVLLLLLLSQDSSPVVKEKTVLIFDLATQIQDTESTPSFNQILSQESQSTLSLRQVLETIQKASKDNRIVAIFLDGRKGGGASGYASLTEIREALQRFRQTGKKIIAYGVDWREPDYFLASIADEILENPIGTIEINGLGAEPLFYGAALAKYGVGVQAVRVGNFKSAVEPFTRQDLSPQNRQQLESLLGGVWQSYIETVATSRSLTTSDLQAIADNQGLLSAQKAQKAKLIDKVVYWDQVVDQLKSLSKVDEDEEKSFRQISLNDYVSVPVKAFPARRSDQKIAVLYLDGTIVNGEGSLDSVGGDRFVKLIRKIRADQDIKAVVVRINSPGGSATASDLIWREVQLLKAKKPVVISMGNVAASGGYWIATGGQHIFAEPTTITGSIGVFSLLFNVETIGNRFGLTWDQVQTSKLANLGSGIRPKSEAELAIFQQAVNQIYDLFLDKVSQSRGLSKAKVAEIAQGRVWTGAEAQKIGLVDDLGGLEKAITYAANQTNLRDNWELDEYPRQKSLETAILESLFKLQIQSQVSKVQTDPLMQKWQDFRAELTSLQTLNDPKGIYARLPFNWKWH
ncbi:MAG: signal peptide peptidase SppA [Snowella sp.]|nr:signal peptide peptidase SppA [Snowella sp.]